MNDLFTKKAQAAAPLTKENTMRAKVGLWIDHRKAIVVTVTDKGEEISLTISAAEKQLRRSGDSPLNGPYESQQVPADDRGSKLRCTPST